MKTLYFYPFVGCELLEYRELPDPVPLADKAWVQTAVIGLNCSAVYRCQGTYHLPVSLPKFHPDTSTSEAR